MNKFKKTILIVLSTMCLSAQSYFSIRLDESTTLQSSISSFIETGSLNYGHWEPGSDISDPNYKIEINSGSINLNGSNETVTLTLHGSLYMDTVLGLLMGFDHTANVTFSVVGYLEMTSDPETGECYLSLSVDDISVNSWPDWANSFVDVALVLGGYWSEIHFINVASFYPILDPY